MCWEGWRWDGQTGAGRPVRRTAQEMAPASRCHPSMSQWSLGPDPPGRRGCTCLLWFWGGWFGSSANFSHWTWGGQAMMGSLRESTLPSKAGTSGRAGRLRGWGPECSDTRLPRRRLLLVCLQIIPLSRGPVSAIRLHGWPVTAQPCTWQSPGAQCHLQVPLDTGEGGQTVCPQAQPAGSSSGATGRRWVPQGVGKG